MPPARAFANLGLFVRDTFLSREECRALTAHMLAETGERAAVFDDAVEGALDSEVRRAWELDVPADQAAAIVQRLRDVRPDLEAHFGVPLDPPEAPSYLRYPVGAFYKVHRDRRESSDPTRANHRAVSVVIFVNGPQDASGFSGGNLRFYGLLGDGALADVGIDAEPQAGTLIAFASTLEHEVTMVERGVRCSIVSWFTGRSSLSSQSPGT